MAEHRTVNAGVVGSTPTSPAACLAARRLPPKMIGELSELAVAHHLTRAGYTVLRPLGDSARYDLAIDHGTCFDRVQVKTGKVTADGTLIRFATSSSQAHRGRGRRDYRGAIELFAVYVAVLDTTYLIPVADVGRVGGTLRLRPTANRQAAGVRWARDYALHSLPSIHLDAGRDDEQPDQPDERDSRMRLHGRDAAGA